MKLNIQQKGFTLIELLVVIAIIGILASIVLVSFPSATKKAKDSRVKSAVGQARTVMTYFASNAGTYTGFSSTSVDMGALATEAKNNAYKAGEGLIITPSTDGKSACMYVLLNEQAGATAYCADATGLAGTGPAAGAAGVGVINSCVAVAAPSCPTTTPMTD
ncbi:MAG: type II secretion system protein [Candidatus Gribaldobacteria bacterium]|nr:type II secretion system protein [Candidatus Gribaldobacteria bacterium]